MCLFLRAGIPIRFFVFAPNGREVGSIMLRPHFTYPVMRIKNPRLHNGPDMIVVRYPEAVFGHRIFDDRHIVAVSFAALRGLRAGIVNLFGSEDDDRDAANAFDAHVAQEVIARIMACYA